MTFIEQAQYFVCDLFKDKLSFLYTYHNFNHTLGVVDAINTLSDSEKLNSLDKEILLIAAWFHDSGYINGCVNHEDSSCDIAAVFLKEHGKSEDYIEKVLSLIKATKVDYIPQNLFEKIIKDADCYHIASVNYASACDGLRTEWCNTEEKVFNDKEWTAENLDFLVKKHQFYTDFALKYWQPLKEMNIQRIQLKAHDMEKEENKIHNKQFKKEEKKKEKDGNPERGRDTLFRITLANHTRLSGIADSKANILLSVNAIIISIALSTIIPKLDSPKNAHLIIPVFIMLISSVITIVFAILSTRPKVTKGVFEKQDIVDKKVNLLFFGNFYKMPLEEYKWAMNEMMKDKEYLYNSMIKDLYFLGLVLEKKYRLLRIAYNLFMAGILLTVISFVIAFKML